MLGDEIYMFDIKNEKVFTPEMIANMLGFSTETVRNWCRCGKLKSYSWGGKYVIKGSDFKKFMEGE
jgi:excisionase family DNA binding protein